MVEIAAAAARGRTPVPVTVLTGFLGAGKTTLLNRILGGDHGLRVAVLVNDFGAINIDAELVVGVESDVISLANGCICCTIRDDLVDAVTTVINRRERPEYIVLEASGVAEPAGLAMTFGNPALGDRLRLDGILCLVDAEQVFAVPEAMELKLFQMACADIIVLNKVDLVDADGRRRIRSWLDSRFHRYRLIEAVRGDVPPAIVLSVGRYAAPAAVRGRPGGEGGAGLHHAMKFSAWTYESDRPLSLPALRAAASALPAAVYRAKGVIYAADMPDTRAVLQVVGRRVDISPGDRWGARTPRTRIVAIGAAGLIDDRAMRAAFDGCAVVADQAGMAVSHGG